MEAFKALLEVHRATAYRAVATSAMRDADNGQELADKVKERTGIKIEIISGREEANVILRSEFGQHRQDNDQDYLYIDVGGGSTELVFFKSGKASASRSFRIGTLRVLNSQVGKGTWEDMRSWLNDHKPDSPEIIGIGSGGNINKMIKLYGKARQIYLDRETVEAAHEHLSNLSYGERVQDLGLKPDRADVIEPASQIFKRIMTWAGVEKLIVPKFGLADGIIRELYLEKNLK
jgi:exopolyphosphatase/guanosine-5'-triphosphate,3'-diphosphate pyrophosphatase